MPSKRYVPGPASPEPLEPILDGRLVEKMQAQLAYTRKPNALANFPGIELDPLWPELMRTLVDALKQRRSQGAFTSSEVEQGEESLFLKDFSNVVRTKLFHEGSTTDLFVKDIESIFAGGAVPRLGVASMCRYPSPNTFKCFDSALQVCGQPGARYFIALLAAHSTEYSPAHAKFIINKFKELPDETFCGIGVLPDDALLPQHMRVSIITA